MSLGTMTRPATASFPAPRRPAGTPPPSGSGSGSGGGSSDPWGGLFNKPDPPPAPPRSTPVGGRQGSPSIAANPTWKAIHDPYYQWQKASDALAQEQYDMEMNKLLRERAMLNSRSGGGGNRAAYNAAMQALESDRARLAADQALSADQQRLALWNRDLTNRAQRGSLMSDAVSRGADMSAGVAQNYIDITDRNQLNYEQAMAQAKRNDAHLAQLAKDYGVREEQIKAALTRGAAAYGMSYAQAMSRIDDAMNSLDMNRRAAALQMQLMFLQNGGTMPSTSTPSRSRPQPSTYTPRTSTGSTRYS